jgi:beta-lactamase superfamily II metal-dependent hydrolase
MTHNRLLRSLGAAAICVVLCTCGEADLDSESLKSGNSASRRMLTIAILDVGHGDSSLIIFPDGKTMLVDAGNESKGRTVVAKFLRDHSIEHLDYYVETHDHGDHVDGRPALDEFIDSRTTKWDWKTHRYGDRFNLGGAEWFITNAYDRSFHGGDANKNSLSYRIEYNDFVYSASGDQATNSMDRLEEDHPDLVRADVRNTAHHGVGPVSSSFLEMTDPEIFVVSAPSSSWVRSAYRDTGKKIYVTGRDGHVIIRASGGGDWQHETCSSRCDLGPVDSDEGDSCDNRCSSSCKCDEDEGDCDSDADCKSGLQCPQNSWENPPGHDVCYNPGDDDSGNDNTLSIIGDNGSPSSAFPLGLCEGDCDRDSDCDGTKGLECYERTGTEPVPGCAGRGISGKDYCYTAASSGDRATAYIGNNGSPGSAFPLGECQGDCDNDSECKTGLECFQRDGGESVPGCSGGSSDNSNTDFCHNPFTE